MTSNSDPEDSVGDATKPTANDSPRCLICNKPDVTQCKQCRSAHYCSQECQQRDWPIHKLLCKTFSTSDRSTRPSKDHFLALYFPIDRVQPELIWLNSDGVDADTKKWVPKTGGGLVESNWVLDRRTLSHTAVVRYNDEFYGDGDSPNLCIKQINAVQGYYGAYGWCGHVLAYLHDIDEEHGTEPDKFPDMDMESFRHITDYLRKD